MVIAGHPRQMNTLALVVGLLGMLMLLMVFVIVSLLIQIKLNGTCRAGNVRHFLD